MPPPELDIPSRRDEPSRLFGFGLGGTDRPAPDGLLKRAIAARELEQEAAIVATSVAELVHHCRICGKRTTSPVCSRHSRRERNLALGLPVRRAGRPTRAPSPPPQQLPEVCVNPKREVPTLELLELERIWPERHAPKRWTKSCKWIDRESGKVCSRLEHPAEEECSASGRPFRNRLIAGTLPRRELDLHATSRRESGDAGEAS